MSQMKVWRIIERRRAERATEHLKKQQVQEQAEEDLGRKIEEENERDRTLWEAAYGGKNGTIRRVASGIGTEASSVRKASLGIVGTNAVVSPLGSIEMNNLEHVTTGTDRDSRSDVKGKGRAAITVRVASDDDVRSNFRPGSTVNGASPASPRSEARTSRSEEFCQRQSEAVEIIKGPNIVPLPFSVPDTDPEGDRRSSIAASISSEPFPTRLLNRLSGTSLKDTSSKRSQRSSYITTSTSEEVVMLPHDDADDRASSVEATFDEISDGHRSEVDGPTLAGLPLPDADSGKPLQSSPPMEPHPIDRPGRQASTMSLGHASSHSVPVQQEWNAVAPTIQARSKTDNIWPASTEDAQPTPSNIPDKGKNNPQDTRTTSPPTPTQPPTAPVPTLRTSLSDLTNSSKLLLSYRTNEWAKHLSNAENPSIDDLRSLHHQQSASAAPTENPAPLNISALRQTPLNAEPAPASNPHFLSALLQTPRNTEPAPAPNPHFTIHSNPLQGSR
ncbi:MAG: hypothetical protein Q9224_002300, partial [Gallowayella concinna]